MGESLREWLDDRVGRSAACERVLREDGRDDEATFERIRGNVFDIARTVLDVAARQDEDGAAYAFFIGRMERLHGEWCAARERALEHGDEGVPTWSRSSSRPSPRCSARRTICGPPDGRG